ncbi:MAG: hypothetical protein ACRYGA_02465 [Janthinobacterium lividum]
MASSAQTKFNDFINQLLRAKHDFSSHVFKIMLTNTAPAAANAIKGDITEIAAGNGYAAGGPASAVTLAAAAGVATVQGAQATITAAGGAIGPFRYAVLYNDTQTAPVKPLVSFLDYGAALTLGDGESLTIKFNNVTPGTIFTAA